MTFSGLNLQSKDNDSFFKKNIHHFQKCHIPTRGKRQCLQVVDTGSMAGSDHRFCILEIKKLTTQVKKKLYQNTHKALEIQYNVCKLHLLQAVHLFSQKAGYTLISVALLVK